MIAVIGLGLIGGSVAWGLSTSGYAAEVIGFDIDPEAGNFAMDRQMIHRFGTDFSEARDARLWIIASPPVTIPDILEQIEPFVRDDATVTDCAGVKSPIAESVPERLQSRFVGGHPIAGKADIGIRHADPNLFVDRPWILCAGEQVSPDALRTVTQLVHSVDAHPHHMSPQEHDHWIAMISHLPNALASALLIMAEKLPRQDLAGGSWHDLTRVGGSHPDLWEQILLLNGEEIIEVISHLRDHLYHLECLIERGDSTGIREWLDHAARVKRLN